MFNSFKAFLIQRVYFFLYGFLAINFSVSLWVKKYLACDVPYYIFTMLELRDLFYFQKSRIFAHYVLKIPAYVAVVFGSYNLELIEYLMVIPLYLQVVISLFLCQKILGSEEKFRICFPLMTIMLGILNAEMAPESETVFFSSVFWPLYFILEKKVRSFKLESLKWLLLLLFGLSYEAIILVTPFLIILEIKNNPRKDKYFFILVTLFFSAGQIYFALNPASVANRASFIIAVEKFFGLYSTYNQINYRLLLCLIMSFLIFPFFMFIKKERVQNIIKVILLLVGALVLIYHYNEPLIVTLRSSLKARTLTALSPIMGLMFIFLYNKSKLPFKKESLIFVTIFLVIFQLSSSLILSGHWHNYLQDYKKILQTHTGVINLSKTQLGTLKNQAEKELLYSEIWTFPLRELFLMKRKNADSILINDRIDIEEQLRLIERRLNNPKLKNYQ